MDMSPVQYFLSDVSYVPRKMKCKQRLRTDSTVTAFGPVSQPIFLRSPKIPQGKRRLEWSNGMREWCSGAVIQWTGSVVAQ